MFPINSILLVKAKARGRGRGQYEAMTRRGVTGVESWPRPQLGQYWPRLGLGHDSGLVSVHDLDSARVSLRRDVVEFKTDVAKASLLPITLVQLWPSEAKGRRGHNGCTRACTRVGTREGTREGTPVGTPRPAGLGVLQHP